MNKKEGTLTLVSQLKRRCSDYDPFGLCTVQDCIKCENCDYKFVDKTGLIVRDFKTFTLKANRMKIQKYLLECFDDVDYYNFEKYLLNNESDYRITRIDSDGKKVILRYSKKDLEEIQEKEQQRKMELDRQIRAMFGDELLEHNLSIQEAEEEVSDKEKRNFLRRVFKRHR